MGSFILGVNIILSTVHVFVRDRSVPTPVKGLRSLLLSSLPSRLVWKKYGPLRR